VLGITFKEDVADIRNSKVAALVHELQSYFVNVHISDPHASPNEVAHEYKLTLVDKISDDYDAVVVAVGHQEYKSYNTAFFKSITKSDAILMDLKALYDNVDSDLHYLRL